MLKHLNDRSNPRRIDRKARIYYHKKSSQVLRKAIVNISSGKVEQDEKIPDVQGPVDWIEFAQVEEACNEHPLVKAEVEKLRLPPGYDHPHTFCAMCQSN